MQECRWRQKQIERVRKEEESHAQRREGTRGGERQRETVEEMVGGKRVQNIALKTVRKAKRVNKTKSALGSDA